MDNLNLPIIKLPIFKTKPLSMDEYLRFIAFNLKYTADIKTGRRLKRETFVNAPFVLR